MSEGERQRDGGPNRRPEFSTAKTRPPPHFPFSPTSCTQAGLGLLTLTLAAAAALSVCALAIGSGDSGWARHARAGYTFQAGWLGYSAWGGAGAPPPATSLRSLSAGTATACIVAAALLAASAALASAYIGVTVCGGAGPHVAAVAAPASVLVAASLGVAYTLVAVFGARAGRPLGVPSSAVPWPDVGLCLGFGSALLLSVASCFACGLPRRHKDAGAACAPPRPAPPGPLQAAALSTPSTAPPFTADLPPDTAASLGARANSAADKTAAQFSSTARPRSGYSGSSSRGGGGTGASMGEGPAAPVSAFGASTDGGVSVAPPAVFRSSDDVPQAPPPEAVPPPSKLGFFQRMASGKKEGDPRV